MMRLSNLTLRNVLIATHDALATALALFASFYLRFEGGDLFYDRVPLLLHILPYFIVFSVVVCYVSNLTSMKWRFTSLPDALNILRASTVMTAALLALDYIFVAPVVNDPSVARSIAGGYFFVFFEDAAVEEVAFAFEAAFVGSGGSCALYTPAGAGE